MKDENHKKVIAGFMVMIAVLGLGWWMSSPDGSRTRTNTETQVSTSDNPTDPEVQNALGDKYYYAKDYEQAVYWYRKSAEQGDATAQCNLGVIYENGYGVTKNLNEARKWYQLSAAQGDEDAKSALQRLK